MKKNYSKTFGNRTESIAVEGDRIFLPDGWHFEGKNIINKEECRIIYDDVKKVPILRRSFVFLILESIIKPEKIKAYGIQVS